MADENNQGARPRKEHQPSEPLSRSYHELLGGNQPAKTSWPELVGVTGEEAKKKVKEEMPAAELHVVPHDSFVTTDFRPQRVRLYVDNSHNVVKAPKIG